MDITIGDRLWLKKELLAVLASPEVPSAWVEELSVYAEGRLHAAASSREEYLDGATLRQRLVQALQQRQEEQQQRRTVYRRQFTVAPQPGSCDPPAALMSLMGDQGGLQDLLLKSGSLASTDTLSWWPQQGSLEPPQAALVPEHTLTVRCGQQPAAAAAASAASADWVARKRKLPELPVAPLPRQPGRAQQTQQQQQQREAAPAPKRLCAGLPGPAGSKGSRQVALVPQQLEGGSTQQLGLELPTHPPSLSAVGQQSQRQQQLRQPPQPLQRLLHLPAAHTDSRPYARAAHAGPLEQQPAPGGGWQDGQASTPFLPALQAAAAAAQPRAPGVVPPRVPQQEVDQPPPERVTLAALAQLLRCPLSGGIMQQPVLAADGITYDCRSIELAWLYGPGVSPVTGQPLLSLDLKPNRLAQAMTTLLLGSRSAAALTTRALPWATDV